MKICIESHEIGAERSYIIAEIGNNHNGSFSRAIEMIDLAHEMGVNLRQTSGPVLERAGDIAAILTNLQENDVLFIDEIHRLSPVIEEILYPAMEDYKLDIMIGEGPAARSIKLELPPFTLIGAKPS